MQLGLSFTALLASILAITAVDAAPVRRGKFVSLPLERSHGLRSDVSPDMQLAQHINRSHKRQARMTGRSEPSDAELTAHLKRRTEVSAPAKRFQRPDTLTTADIKSKTWTKLNAAPAARSFATEEQKRHVEALAEQLKAGKQGNKAGKFQGKGKAIGKGAAAGAAAGAVTGAAAGAVVDGAGAANSTAVATDAADNTAAAADSSTLAADSAVAAGGAADASTAAGFSKDALAAQQAGGLTESNTPNTKDALALDIEANDVGYIATVQIGTPPKDFRLLMDSGSSDLWVGNADACVNIDTKVNNCGKHTFLGASTSTSFKDTKAPFQVTYGTGAVAGTIINDDLSFAGLSLKAHTFGTANQETDDFANDRTTFDGLMGLAQSTLSNQKVLTPPEALAKNNLIGDAIVSYKIPRFLDNKKDGQITFGAVDPATIDAATSVTLANVNKQGFWEADLGAASIGGKDSGLTGRTAILDTGTTLIVAPQTDVEAVLSLVAGAKTDGQGNFLIPCTTSDQLALEFGGKSFTVDPRDLIFAPADPNDLTGDCIPGISAGNIGGATEWLVGDVFLKNAVFTTDVTKNNIQLAKPAAK